MSKLEEKNVNEIACQVASLMGEGSFAESYRSTVGQAVELAVQAQKKLVSNGLSEVDAIAKVKSNFDRCNLSGQIVTLDELCK